MKKILLFIMLLIIPISVSADTMYSVDMDIEILEDGSANITEMWNVKADNGSEWYKQLYNLGNSQLSNFVVYMDGYPLSYKEWDVNESLHEKRGYYGINYTADGLELCFGKYDYNNHKFTLKYTISNFVFNTSDSQVLYWTLMPNVTLDNFSVDVTSYYYFPDNLDVWGYGYKGYAYVKDGKISMSNEGPLRNNYVVLLAKFPLGTFNTSNMVDGYTDFNTVYNMAANGSYEYNYDTILDNSFFAYFISIIVVVLIFLPVVIFEIVKFRTMGYGYKDNKSVSKKDVPMFRDIPCNKDIHYANALLKLNKFGNKETNILGAIILKWVRNNKVLFKNEQKGIFNKNTSIIDLTLNPSFDNEYEERLFAMMYEASRDGYLETREFEKWCNNNYSKFLDLFKKMENSVISSLKENGKIYKRTFKSECKYQNIMNDEIYDESVKLYGLKKYLEEFSNMDTKEVMEVRLWDEYLMFAYLFGIADKVAKQLKNMYPEVIHQMESMNYDYDTILFINHISTRSVRAASAARSAAESYSAGGGGFSSGGGGGGSFGGGGSMGGR